MFLQDTDARWVSILPKAKCVCWWRTVKLTVESGSTLNPPSQSGWNIVERGVLEGELIFNEMYGGP